eukprot:7175531-Alexandrium_andersonii.AAC.1
MAYAVQVPAYALRLNAQHLCQCAHLRRGKRAWCRSTVSAERGELTRSRVTLKTRAAIAIAVSCCIMPIR